MNTEKEKLIEALKTIEEKDKLITAYRPQAPVFLSEASSIESNAGSNLEAVDKTNHQPQLLSSDTL